MGRVYIVASGKGGTGKTTVCAGVSCALAALGKKVLVVDADAGLKNLDIALGMSDRAVMSFADVLAGRASLISAAAAHPSFSRLFLLTAPAGASITESELSLIPVLLSEARRVYDFVFIDCPAGIGGMIPFFSKSSDSGIVVCTPDAASLRGAERMVSELSLFGLDDLRLVINRIRPALIRRKGAFNLDDVIDSVRAPLVGIIPEDERVIISSNTGQAVLPDRHNGAAQAYSNIAKRLCGASVPLMKIKKIRIKT